MHSSSAEDCRTDSIQTFNVTFLLLSNSYPDCPKTVCLVGGRNFDPPGFFRMLYNNVPVQKCPKQKCCEYVSSCFSETLFSGDSGAFSCQFVNWHTACVTPHGNQSGRLTRVVSRRVLSYQRRWHIESMQSVGTTGTVR